MTAATFFKILAPLTSVLPTPALDYVATKVADLAYFTLKPWRRAVFENMARVLGPHSSRRMIRTAVRNCFRNHARCTVDILRIPYLDRSAITSMVECHGFEHTADALKERRGLILVTPHLGNWDLLACYLGARRVPLSVVVELTDETTFAFYKKRREHTGITTIPLTAPPLAFVQVLRENRVLGLVGDRDLAGSGARVKFFDAGRMLPTGPERLARVLQAPVSVCYMVLGHHSPYRYLVHIDKVEYAGSGEPLTNRLARKFEQLIRQYPDQWFVFQDEWLN